MKRKAFGASALTLVVALIGFLTVPAAHADYAEDVIITIDVGGGTFVGGDDVPVTVTATKLCNWGVRLTIEGGGSSSSTIVPSSFTSSAVAPIQAASTTFSTELSSPVVASATGTTVAATCNPADGGDAVTASAQVTLLPRDGGAFLSGVLPGTGGAPVLLLVAGLVLLGAGSAATIAARRRAAR